MHAFVPRCEAGRIAGVLVFMLRCLISLSLVRRIPEVLGFDSRIEQMWLFLQHGIDFISSSPEP